MTRSIFTILLLLLFQLGFSQAFAQTQQPHSFSLHMTPAAQSQTTKDDSRKNTRYKDSPGGSVFVMAQDRNGLETGEIVFQRDFQDTAAMLAIHSQLMIELFGSDFDQCVTIDNKNSKRKKRPNGPTTAAGGKGTDGLPGGMNDDWSGSGDGGCGTWATAMCNRILGKAKGKVTKGEWNKIAKGINQGEGGGSTATDRAAYYKKLGCSSSTSTFSGTQEAYEEIQAKLKAGYDVKLRFRKVVPHWFFGGLWNSYENGHVETVTGVKMVDGKLVAETNSWGKTGQVSGGNMNGFGHSRQGATGGFPKNSWPAGSTKVEVTYIGPCK